MKPSRYEALVTLMLAVALLGCHGFFEFSTFSGYMIPVSRYLALVSSPDPLRYAAYGLLAGLVPLLWWLPEKEAKPRAERHGWLALFLLMASLSCVIGGNDPRRLLLLLLAIGLSSGLSRAFSSGELLRITIAVPTILLAVGFISEVVLGSFTPLLQSYRFTGFFHPNQQGANVAVLLSSLFMGLRVWPEKARWLSVGFGVGCAFLALTGSRSCSGALLVGLSLLVLIPPKRAQNALLWSVGLVCSALLGAFSLLQHPSILGGRGPLWLNLWASFEGQPWLGYGYGGFWTPERISEVSAAVAWPVPNAHSSYLELLLGVGVIGCVPVVFWLVRVLREALESTPTLWGQWALLHCVLALLIGLMESNYAFPTTLLSLTFLSVMMKASENSSLPERKIGVETAAVLMSALAFAWTMTHRLF